MIISHAHKYVFVENPRTASEAIRAELRQLYDGQPFLHKHANFTSLPKKLRRKVRGYVVFAGVRNPLDDAASEYQRLLNNKHGVYTDPSQWAENGGWVDGRQRKLFSIVQSGATFLDFLKSAHRYTYCSRASVNKRYCDQIIRFENLQDDFTAVLKRIGITPKRALPLRHATPGKRHYSEYYEDSALPEIARIFGPFMIEWGYLTEADPMFRHVNRIATLKYRIMKLLHRVHHRLAHQRRVAFSFRKARFRP